MLLENSFQLVIKGTWKSSSNLYSTAYNWKLQWWQSLMLPDTLFQTALLPSENEFEENLQIRNFAGHRFLNENHFAILEWRKIKEFLVL